MWRFIALLTITAQISTMFPAYGSSLPGRLSAQSPCDFAGTLLTLRGDITEMGNQARDAGTTAMRIRRSSRSAPYKYVEHLWAGMTTTSKPLLNQLSDMQNTLDQMADGKEKQAATALVLAYQNAVQMFLDYGHFALYDERRANAMSMRFYTIFATGKNQSNVWVNPGADREKTRMFGEVMSRQFLDQQIFEVSNAFQSLKLPEYRYNRACADRSSLPNAKPVIADISSPCDLATSFGQLHAQVQDAGSYAHDADDVAKKTHRTSRWTPYKRVESDWSELTKIAVPAMETLSDFPLALDRLPMSNAKQAALDLTNTYQNAIMKIADYAHYAVFYERISNGSGVGAVDRDIWSFGVMRGNTKSSYDNYSRNFVEMQNLVLGDALRSLKLAEYHYQRACDSSSSDPSIARASTTKVNPCTLSSQFSTIRKTITELNLESRDIGATSLHLRKTSVWRPYKHIESQWLDLTQRSDEMLNKLADMPILLEQAPDGAKKLAAENLTTSYQNALEHLVNYARAALYYERTENTLSSNYERGYLTFGVFRTAVKMNRDNIGRSDFDRNLPEANRAMRLIRLPEYHYERLCDASLASR